MSEKKKKSVVVVGGGTGTFNLLSGLKHHKNDIDITVIVNMMDSGGSAGRLRDEFGYLPVGDVRMALVALSREEEEDDILLRKLFLHRFATEGSIGGHNFGNLFLVALTDILGSEEEAVIATSKVLRVSGTVLPITTDKVHLVAQYADGTRVVGEHHIDEPEEGRDIPRIIEVSLEPEAALTQHAKDALLNADLIVFGPGDLYTSIIANCVVTGLRDVIQESKASIAYVGNLMTKYGQTINMTASEQYHELARYIGRNPDVYFFNTTPLPEAILKRYEASGEHPVELDADSIPCTQVLGDLLATEEIVRKKGDVLKRSLIRHDAEKLAQALVTYITK